MLPPEVWQLVSDYLTTREFLVVSSLNRANRAYLCLRKAVRPKLLDASRSPNKPHPLFRNLHTLIAAGSYKITCFPSTLTSLDISYNKHIRVIDLPKLTRLRACGIPLTEELFTGLNLEQLIIPSCDSIPLAVQRMTSLKQLDISKTCCDQFTLRNLHLTHLIAFNCPRLTDLSFMTSLTHLDISWRCGVGDRSLHTLVNLTKLDVSHNPQVSHLHHLAKLTNLSARFCYLQSLPPNLTKLDLSHCQTRLQLNQLHRLRDLRIEGRECLIDQGSIDGLRLTKLNITDNPRIYHLESLLTSLRIGGNSLGQSLLDRQVDLVSLDITDNPNIVDISRLRKLRILYTGYRNNIPLQAITNLGFRMDSSIGRIRFVRS